MGEFFRLSNLKDRLGKEAAAPEIQKAMDTNPKLAELLKLNDEELDKKLDDILAGKAFLR